MVGFMKNKVKIIPGQIWECKIKAKFVDVGEQCKIVELLGIERSNDFSYIGYGDNLNHLCPISTSGSTYEMLRRHFEFIPKTDLEWLAVNVDLWAYKSAKLIQIDQSLPGLKYVRYGCDGNTILAKFEYHTKQQWQDKRYELGLDDQTEIKIPLKWVKEKGIKIHSGDIVSDFESGRPLVDSQLENINNYEYLGNVGENKFFITSFAERENTGEQPFDDCVPIDTRHINDVEHENIKSDGISWQTDVYGYMTHYKPNIEALYEIYKSEQIKNSNQLKVESLTRIMSSAENAINQMKRLNKALSKFSTKEKETKLKLTKDDVGKQFECDKGNVFEIIAFDKVNAVAKAQKDSGYFIVNHDGSFFVLGTRISKSLIKRHEPRWWLSHLPKGIIEACELYAVDCIECDNFGWHGHGSNGDIKTLDNNKMPKLIGAELNLSKISIVELSEFKKTFQ